MNPLNIALILLFIAAIPFEKLGKRLTNETKRSIFVIEED